MSCTGWWDMSSSPPEKHLRSRRFSSWLVVTAGGEVSAVGTSRTTPHTCFSLPDTHEECHGMRGRRTKRAQTDAFERQSQGASRSKAGIPLALSRDYQPVCKGPKCCAPIVDRLRDSRGLFPKNGGLFMRCGASSTGARVNYGLAERRVSQAR